MGGEKAQGTAKVKYVGVEWVPNPYAVAPITVDDIPRHAVRIDAELATEKRARPPSPFVRSLTFGKNENVLL